MALTGANNEQKIWNYLKKKGLNDFGVAGCMGNLYAESALVPTNLQNTYEKKLGYTDTEYVAAVDSGKYTNFVKDSAGFGLAQWTYWSRKQNLLDFAKKKGKSIGDLEMQLDFLWKELSEGYKSVLNTLKTATSVLEASNDMLFKFERPANQGASVQKKRAEYGQKYYDKYAAKATEQTPSQNSSQLVVGATVNFTGTTHYASSNSSKAVACKPGEAKITAVAKNAKHPYHLVRVSGKGSTVYGWVNASDIAGSGNAGETNTPAASTSDFKQRTTAPSASDRYWVHTSNGGLNECIEINNSGSCLPNCVGYAWGRFYEITGKRPALSRANAENWWGYTADGYKRSQTPVEGAVICWRKGRAGYGNDGAGHVAIVEEVKSNGDVLTSNSAYGGTRFYMHTVTKASGYSIGSAYTFQGFILPPADVAKLMGTTASKPTTKPSAPETTPVVSGVISVGDVVKIASDATYYNGKTIPGWVKNKKWIVREVSGDRAVIDKSEDGKNAICSPINTKYLTAVNKPVVEAEFEPYRVKVDTDALNIRKGAGTNYAVSGTIRNKGVYTIVSEADGKGANKWGKLKSGAGWISLDYTKKV